MDYKTFGEDAEIEYIVTAIVNGEEAGQISGYSYESVSEDWRKLDHAVDEELRRQFEDLPENIELEDEE